MTKTPAQPKRIKTNKASNGWIWRVVKSLMKKARVGDEIGFTLGRTHWVLRKGEFSKE